MNDVKALAFFDLDGTLLNAQSQVDPEVAAAMVQLKKNKVMPIIATGRTNLEIQDIMKQASINSAITMNGQYVEFDGQEVFSSVIETDICKKMLELTQKNGHDLGFYTPHHITVTSNNQIVQDCYNFIHSGIPSVDSSFYLDASINMLLVISKDGDELYHEAFPALTFYRNGPFSIDTVSLGGSKGIGVQRLVEKLGFFDLPTFAFGDGPNDIALFEACQNKIAMGNAKPELKELATYETAKNTEGGIVQALKHFDLL